MIKRIMITDLEVNKNNLFLHIPITFENKRVLKYRKQLEGIDLLYTEEFDLEDNKIGKNSRIILNNVIPKAMIKNYILEKQKFLKENGVDINVLPGVIKEIEIPGINTNTLFNWRLDYCKKLFDNFKTFQLSYGLTLNTEITKKIEVLVNKNTVLRIYPSKERVHVDFKFIELNLKVEDLENNIINNLIKKSILDFKLGFGKNKKYPTFVEVLEKRYIREKGNI